MVGRNALSTAAYAPRLSVQLRRGALGFLLLLTGCRSAPQAQTTHLPAISGITATLQDEVRDLPNEMIAWSTNWKLCWAAYPNATGYELQTVTGEGTSKKIRAQSDNCFGLQAAAGENPKAKGLLNRELQLALQRGQLAYRVRAVLPDDRRSEWSAAIAVGKEIPAK
jgi:hypothetical protein